MTSACRLLSPISDAPELCRMDVAALQAAFGSGALSPVDVARAALDRAGEIQQRLNAFTLIGQTATPEFGWKAVTDSPAFGITRNPWNPGRTPGGSSGGAAVAAATGAGVLHLGTDGGGSIRVPAAFTGTFGLKPTFGRVAADPPSFFGTVAHIGPITRSPADARAMLRAMEGRSLRDWAQPCGTMPALDSRPFGWRGRRIALWMEPPGGSVDPVIAKAVAGTVARIEAAGALVRPVRLPEADLQHIFRAHWMAGAASRLAGIPADRRGELDPGFVEAAAEGSRFGLIDYISAQQARARFGAAMDRLLAGHDLLLSPATSCLPFAAGQEVPPGSGLSRWTEWAGFSYPINLSQQPACSLPCAIAGDLPVGLQIVGPRGQDGLVLDAAEAVLRLLEEP